LSGSYFDPNWTEKVTVPVKRVGERWEFFYGGDVPVKEGSFAQLTLEAAHITNPQFREHVTRELTVKILEEGTPLLVALSDQVPGQAKPYWPDLRPLRAPAGTTRVERVHLGPSRLRSAAAQQDPEHLRGGLWLKLKGLERSELLGSTVLMPPGFAQPEAVSLNHAFTLLSQAYETHRISNTGNVYTRFFYQERDGQWHPLDELRMGAQATGERQLLNSLWAEVEQKLGWRHTPVVDHPRTRKQKK